jgi:hypothetical protein
MCIDILRGFAAYAKVFSANVSQVLSATVSLLGENHLSAAA